MTVLSSLGAAWRIEEQLGALRCLVVMQRYGSGSGKNVGSPRGSSTGGRPIRWWESDGF